MKYKEAIKKIPSGCTVSIGCRKEAGWFYFTKSDDLKTETEIIFKLMDDKMKKSLNQMRYNLARLRSQMNDFKFIHNVSTDGYIRNWKALIKTEERIPKAWLEYGEFNIIELLNCDCYALKKMDGSYGILLDKWSISGNYWTKQEWEADNGEI